jgi:DNA-binding GntR family transcriptional regulator
VAPRGTFRQIAAELRRRIGSGELLPGTLVASEMSLVEEYGVSRGTVRSALALLVDEGLVEVVPGQGRRVVGQAVSSEPATAYERIARELQERLDAGEFGADEPLPSEAELVAAYGVSRNTARRAYQHLAESGAVVIRHGAGAFPAPR